MTETVEISEYWCYNLGDNWYDCDITPYRSDSLTEVHFIANKLNAIMHAFRDVNSWDEVYTIQRPENGSWVVCGARDGCVGFETYHCATREEAIYSLLEFVDIFSRKTANGKAIVMADPSGDGWLVRTSGWTRVIANP